LWQITTWWQPTVRSKDMVRRLLFCSFSNASRQLGFFLLMATAESSTRYACRTTESGTGDDGKKVTSMNPGCMIREGAVPRPGQRNSFLTVKKSAISSERPHPKFFSSPRTAGKRRRTRGRVTRPERSGGWASSATGQVPIRECATLAGSAHDIA
jgi:hypothetical protein